MSNRLAGPERILLLPREEEKRVRFRFGADGCVSGKVVAEFNPACDHVTLEASADEQGLELVMLRKLAIKEISKTNVVIRCTESSGVSGEAWSTPVIVFPQHPAKGQDDEAF